MPMPNASLFSSHSRLIRSVLILLLLVPGSARAEGGLPEGTLGWWYYTGMLNPDRYAADPVTACQKGAMHHARQSIVAMRPVKGRRDYFECAYRWPTSHGPVSWLGEAILRCEPGYQAYGQGVCRKQRPESPAPLKCGEAAGNPVQFASGAKVQHEIDLD
ncbi:hypothetical protein PO883_30240, partial [Massilia sp. DJPM01]|uniref:hypothetical protein n=1 Tax=Massilia sp. DJPM01 TaxID=3024404 RepID=UPI00259E2204